MNFQERLKKFMKGRYGPDELYMFLFKLYIILLILNIFINSKIINIVELLIFLIIFYRFFSKKIYKRANENNKFIEIKNKIKNFNIKSNKNKDYIYKKCRKCKTTLRLPLPYERGIKYAKCPKCKSKVRMLVLRKQKVEIVK